MMKIFFSYPKTTQFCPGSGPFRDRFSVVLGFLLSSSTHIFAGSLRKGSVEVGKSCPLKMFSDFHIN